jgi:hypothetical protein
MTEVAKTQDREEEYSVLGLTRLARRNIVVAGFAVLILTNCWTAKQWLNEQEQHEKTREKLLLCKDTILLEVKRLQLEYIIMLEEERPRAKRKGK